MCFCTTREPSGVMIRRPKILPPYLSVLGIDLLETEFENDEPAHTLSRVKIEYLAKAIDCGAGRKYAVTGGNYVRTKKQ